MSYEQVNSSLRPRPHLSSTQKKQILWNIIEPGDPYDIKKSMIAQLPGDMHNFMGGHLEIVCLMQAAEIERLCEYLDEYKQRYRDIERRELDRHSYEVQIKQLTQKILESGANQTENLKLREFLKKQTAQLDELRKKTSSDDGINRKYEEALHRIQITTNENNSLKVSNNHLNSELQQIRAKISALEQTKLREIEDLKFSLTSQSNATYERWKQEITFQFQTERNGLEIQVKRLKEVIESKNREIEEYQGRYRKLQIDFDQQGRRQEVYGKIEITLREYESKFGVLSIEIERLNQVLMGKAHECQDFNSKLRQTNDEIEKRNRQIYEFTQKIRKYQIKSHQANMTINDLNEKNFRLGESEETIRKYDIKIGEFIEQIERLNNIIKKKVTEITQLQGMLSDMEYELRKIDFVKRENDDLKRFVNQNSELKRSLVEIENRAHHLMQENERINNNLKLKIQQLHSVELRSKSYERDVQGYRSRLEVMERQISNNWKSKFTILQNQNSNFQRENDELRRRLLDLDQLHKRLTDYQNRIALMSQEIERLNEVIKGTINQNESFKRRLNEAGDLSKINKELQSKIMTMTRTRISETNIQIDELQRKLQQVSVQNRKIPEYESKFTIFSQELQRLNANLRSKVDENSSLQNRLRTLQVQFNECEKSRIENEHQLHYQRGESENLKSKLSEANETRYSLHQYESRIVVMNDELERLQNNLKGKIDELFTVQSEIEILKGNERNLKLENEELKRFTRRIEEEGKSKINDYGNRIQSLGEEIQRLNTVLRTKTQSTYSIENQNRQLQYDIQNLKKGEENSEIRITQINQEYQIKIAQITTQFQTTITNYQNKSRQYIQEIDELKRKLYEFGDVNRKISEYESKSDFINQEFNKLNGNLKLKIQENENLNNALRSLQIEYDNIRRNGNDNQFKIVQITQDFQYKITTYQSKLQIISNQNEQLKRRLQELSDVNRRINEYQDKLQTITAQLQRVNLNLRAKVDQNNNLNNAVRNIQTDFDNLRRTSERYEEQISTYEIKMKQTIQQNEELRRRILDLSDVNRKVGDYQNSVGTLSAEIQRLNDVLKIKLSQNSNLQADIRQVQLQNEGFRRNISEYEIKITQITHEYQSKIKIYENSSNQQLNVKLRELSEANIRLGQYENRISLIGEQIQRLNRVLRDKDQECTNLQGQLRSTQQEIQGIRRNCSEFQYKFSQEQQLNDQLKVRLQNLGDVNRRLSYYEAKIALLTQQIERLNSVLRGKSDENSNLQNKNRLFEQQIERLQRGTGDYDEKFTRVSQQIQRLNQVLHTTTDELAEYRQKDIKYLSEIERLNNTLRLKVQESSRYELSQSELISKFRLFQQKIAQLTGENNSLKNNNMMLSAEYENSKKHLLEYEASIKKLYAEFERLQTMMHELKKENSMLKGQSRDVDDLIEKNRFLSAEIDRLNGIIQGMKIEISELRLRFADETALQKRISEHMALMVILFAEIESLRQRVKDKEKEVEDVRRSSLAPFKV